MGSLWPRHAKPVRARGSGAGRGARALWRGVVCALGVWRSWPVVWLRAAALCGWTLRPALGGGGRAECLRAPGALARVRPAPRLPCSGFVCGAWRSCFAGRRASAAPVSCGWVLRPALPGGWFAECLRAPAAGRRAGFSGFRIRRAFWNPDLSSFRSGWPARRVDGCAVSPWGRWVWVGP